MHFSISGNFLNPFLDDQKYCTLFVSWNLIKKYWQDLERSIFSCDFHLFVNFCYIFKEFLFWVRKLCHQRLKHDSVFPLWYPGLQKKNPLKNWWKRIWEYNGIETLNVLETFICAITWTWFWILIYIWNVFSICTYILVLGKSMNYLIFL